MYNVKKKDGEKVKQTFIEPCVRVWRTPLFSPHMALLKQYSGIWHIFQFYFLELLCFNWSDGPVC